jgi:hypothetical protein
MQQYALAQTQGADDEELVPLLDLVGAAQAIIDNKVAMAAAAAPPPTPPMPGMDPSMGMMPPGAPVGPPPMMSPDVPVPPPEMGAGMIQ